MTTIIVEGIGDIVTKPTGYARALRKLKIDKEDEVRIIFVDVCDEWHKSADPDLVRVRMDTREKLKSWGAEFIDKSPSNEAGRQAYDDLLHQSVDAVFVATPDRHHISVAKHWLTGNCKGVFIEKPLTNDLDEAERWLNELDRRDLSRLTQLDHYLLKIHPQFKYQLHVREMLDRIARLRHLRFYMLEDHSGTDQAFLGNPERKLRGNLNGPIEIENRIQTLNDGLSLDMLPHLFAIVFYFGDPRTVEITELCPAKYAGVNFNDQEVAGIAGETFAAIKFVFKDHSNHRVTGEAYIGKGIRGSRKYPSMDGNVKVLELEGEWGGRVIEFDFNNSIISEISTITSPGDAPEPDPLVDLEPDPYYYLCRDIVFKRKALGRDLGLPIRFGVAVLETIINQITSRTLGASLPTYLLGDNQGRLPPLLEDLLLHGSQPIPPL
jgi:predicted dehydrogenase